MWAQLGMVVNQLDRPLEASLASRMLELRKTYGLSSISLAPEALWNVAQLTCKPAGTGSPYPSTSREPEIGQRNF